MATRQKTIEYSFPALASMVDNTLTSMTQITVYIPESGKTFRKVTAYVNAQQTATANGNVTSRRLQCRLGAAAYANHANANLHNGSGEDINEFHALDLTAHFVANWTGTFMTMDAQVLMDGTATAVAWTNVCVTVQITYDYDDTSATQVKTVRIPLNMPVAALGTVKPAALATIPNLSTELPEASKVFREVYIVVQGNTAHAAATTDLTLTFQLDATASHTTGIFEGGQASDYWFRYIWDCSAVLNTSAAMDWFAWSNAAKFNHSQAYLVVTYEFDATAANDVFVSLLLPTEVVSPMGGTAVGDAQRATRELWIQEPGTITTKQLAYYVFWDQAAAIAGLQMRIGTGGYIAYTDTAATVCGGLGAMIRNDSAFVLARGRNTLSFDCYTTDTTDLGFNISGFWIVNYTAGKPTQGYGAANRTIFFNLGAVFDGAPSVRREIAAVAPTLPAGSHFLTAIGTNYQYLSNSTGNPAGVTVVCRDDANVEWLPAYVDIGYTDPESGLRQCWSQIRELFKRWTGDPDTSRMELTTARKWRAILNNNCTSFDYLDLIYTCHNITYAVAGTISNSAGGTVNLALHREASGEEVLTTSRVGNGAYSFTWFDNTEEVFVRAYETDTKLGESAPGLAA